MLQDSKRRSDVRALYNSKLWLDVGKLVFPTRAAAIRHLAVKFTNAAQRPVLCSKHTLAWIAEKASDC